MLGVDNQTNMSHSVAVIGYGMSGAATAIALHDLGLNVTIYEKNASPGGISLLSGGGIRISTNADQTATYLKHLCGDTVSDTIINKFSQSMSEIEYWIDDLCKQTNCSFEKLTNDKLYGQVYDYPGHDSLQFLRVNQAPLTFEYKDLVMSSGSKFGVMLFNMLRLNVEKRNITVKYNSGVKQPKEMDHDIVVLSCGGFENNDSMKKDYFQGQPILINGYPHNTGDGIKYAQSLGADLWHMRLYHGSYGFDMGNGVGARVKGFTTYMPGTMPPDPFKTLRFIIVDAEGKRFMNEWPPYYTDHSYRPMETYNFTKQMFDRIPAYFIADETSRQAGPWGTVRSYGCDVADWSDDNEQEIKNGVLTKHESIQSMAHEIGCSVNTLSQTLNDWNKIVDTKDDTLGRPIIGNEQIQDAPYYVGKLYPVVGNTQGGPKTNHHRQVLDAFGDVIPNLYTAGECGSIFGNIYMSGGNISECFISAQQIKNKIKEQLDDKVYRFNQDVRRSTSQVTA